MEKFAGVGLVNIIVIWLICSLLTVIAKVIFTKYEVGGLSDVVRTS